MCSYSRNKVTNVELPTCEGGETGVSRAGRKELAPWPERARLVLRNGADERRGQQRGGPARSHDVERELGRKPAEPSSVRVTVTASACRRRTTRTPCVCRPRV